MTWAELARVAAWLQAHLVGAHIQKIRQPRENEIVLECRVPAQSWWIALSAHPRFYRAVVAREKREAPSEAAAFCMLLRKRLVGGAIEEAAIDPRDRVLTLAVRKAEDGEPPAIWTLVAELFGPQSNLLLLDPDGGLAGALFDNRLASRGLRQGEPYSPPPRAGEPSALDRGIPIEAMAEAFAQAEGDFERETWRARLTGAVNREQKRLRKFADRLRAELGGLADHEQLTRRGELLLAHLRQVKKGMASVELPDWSDPPATVRIDLDPARSPAENADLLFKTARRNRRKAADLQTKIRAAEDRLLAIEEATLPLAAADEAALGVVEQHLREMRVAVERPRQAPPRQRETAPSGPRPFTAADGARIFVGRDAEENDELTFRVARGNDYWLHLEGAPGSHVVIKLPPSGELSSETLLDAANLALLHSSQKAAGAGSVLYTRRKFLKKPKDAKAGLVYAAAAKSIYVKLDDARVKRLYASREGPG
jgi:predicted ribosome quality control (RQC) complex YloA/Tae2 family protein